MHGAACGTSLAFSRREHSPPLPPFSHVSPTVCVFAMAQVHKFKLSLLTDGGGRAEHFLPKSHSCFFHIERTCCTRRAADSNTPVCFVHDARFGRGLLPALVALSPSSPVHHVCTCAL